MHDPDVMVLRLHLPWPALWWRSKEPRGIRRKRYTGEPRVGEPMYPAWRPIAWEVNLFGRHIVLKEAAALWHHEPGGRDYGSVCGRIPDGSGLTMPNVRWAWEHREHCHWQIVVGSKVRGWLTDRCEECGRRFLWRDARIGTGWDSPGVLHLQCSNLRHQQTLIADLTAYVRFDATAPQRSRVEHQLEQIGVAPPAPEDGGV
jgi:hypothetical protein